MASLEEQVQSAENAVLRIKVRAAISVVADVIRAEAANTPNHSNRLKFSKRLNEGRERYVDPFLHAVIAQSRALSFSQIGGLSDTDVQTAVSAAVDIFADGT